LLFTNKGYINLEVLRALFTNRNSLGIRLGKLNVQVQQFFREWNKCSDEPFVNTFIDFFEIPFLKKLHLELEAQHSVEDLIAQCEENLNILEQMAAEIYRKVSSMEKGTPKDMKINPYKFSLELTNEALLEQATQKGAIDTTPSISNDLEIVWLKEKLAV